MRDLISRTVHQERSAAHQRQVAEQQNLNAHHYEAHAPAPSAAVGERESAMVPDQVMALLKQIGETT